MDGYTILELCDYQLSEKFFFLNRKIKIKDVIPASFAFLSLQHPHNLSQVD